MGILSNNMMVETGAQSLEPSKPGVPRVESFFSNASRKSVHHAQLATDLEGLTAEERLARLAKLETSEKVYDERLSAT